MPRYTYIAKSQPQKIIHSDIEAESQQDAVNKITRLGYFPVSISPEDLSVSKYNWYLRRALRKDIVVLTRQLANLLKSGVNILNSFNMISQQSSHGYLKAILADIASKIKDGKSLSDSLATHQQLFPDLYTSMVRCGEASGNVGQALGRLADFLEKEEEFKNSLRAALTYPFFVFIVGVLTVVMLLVFVIPRLVTMFTDMGQVLPLPTRILIGVSGVLHNYWWLILAVTLILFFGLGRLRSTGQGRFYWDKFKLKLAVFGDIILKAQVSRMMRTLSLLLSSGMPITPALNIATSVVDNEVIKRELGKFKDAINSGASLSSTLKQSRLFPDLVANVVAIAEETGTLDKSLMRIAEDYEYDVDRRLKTLTRLLEPIIILVMGLVVGFIVLSMLLPVFQINIAVQ